MSNKPTIPYGRQSISEADILAVIDVLRSDWLTQGPAVERFERAVADYCGARFAVAVNSATSALHISCLAAGLGPGDSLWTTPNTFVASANCGLYCGAAVDFVDIDPQTYNMSVDALAKKLEEARSNGSVPKVVIPVHFAGQSCEMDRIHELSQKYGFSVIEDASHAIGGRYRKQAIGSCVNSDMTVFSFHPVKIVTTGEGGMVLTNSEVLYDKLVRLRSHGITRDPDLMRGESHGPWYYQQIELGFNYRTTDIQAALGASQLSRLDEFVRHRHILAKRYDEAFANLPLTLPWQHPDTYSSYHLYVIRLTLEETKMTHLGVFEALREAGIGVNLHYIPVHSQPYFQRLGFKAGYCPEAEQYYREAISIPLFHGLKDDDQEYVISAIQKVLR
ncbi:MAG TPA: UDP-4-amino-4,6-dideoxy-N-acetyl-beta-L-altrosamine transaminase [Desulfuromonadales bacterium]|nr:UDP-4-amino-4,6-dideoxy-N-acetyl-beta-L-altrosamine transaminase [Desulfuromonadales bacterium]